MILEPNQRVVDMTGWEAWEDVALPRFMVASGELCETLTYDFLVALMVVKLAIDDLIEALS